jgi:hypothetical protein
MNISHSNKFKPMAAAIIVSFKPIEANGSTKILNKRIFERGIDPLERIFGQTQSLYFCESACVQALFLRGGIASKARFNS